LLVGDFFSRRPMNAHRLQQIAFGCLSVSGLVLLLRRQGESLIGQSRAALPPYLVISHGNLVSVQHTFSSPSGVRVILVPLLPVAQRTFYKDVVRDLVGENALVLREGVRPDDPIPAVEDAGTPQADGVSEFDREFVDPARLSVEWRDYDSAATESSGTTPEIAAGSSSKVSIDIIHQSFFDKLVSTECSSVMADLSDSESRWRLSKIFDFRPLAPDRLDRLLQSVKENADRMQYGTWGVAASGTATSGFIPDALAIPWNAGECPEIAEALKERGYVLVSKSNRVILDRASFRNVFRLRVTDDSTGSVMALASKAVRV